MSQGQAMRSILGRSRVTHFMLFPWPRLLAAPGEVVEGGHAVGFGPHAHRARSRNMLVLQVDVLFTVEHNHDARAGELDPKRVPLIGRYRSVDVFDGMAAAA